MVPALPLLIVVFLACPTAEAMCPMDCICRKNNLDNYAVYCDSGLPIALPNNTVHVHLKDIGISSISEDLFNDRSWTTVRNLFLEDNFDTTAVPLQSIMSFAFKGMSMLERLKIKGKLLSIVHYDAFKDLIRLKELDLSFTSIDPDPLIDMMEVNDQFLSHLEILDISNLYKVRWIDVAGTLFKSRPLRSFNASGIQIEVSKKWDLEYFLLLQVLNASKCKVVYLDQGKNVVTTPPLLRIVDISDTNFILPVSNFQSDRIFYFDSVDSSYASGIEHFINITEIYAKHVFPFKIIANGTNMLLLPNITLNVKVVHFENNGLMWANVTFSGGNVLSSLEEVYLGQNEMQYISPNILQNMTNLRILDLSFNDLYIMSKFSEFALLFSHSCLLTSINIARNRIKTLPVHLFRQNTKLEIINLSYNRLDNFLLELKHLVRLSELYLSHNRLKLLDELAILHLKTLYEQQKAHNARNSSKFILDLQGNPLQCFCENTDSIAFLVEIQTQLAIKSKFTCSIEDENVPIDADILDHVQYLCKRSKMILLSTTLSAGLFICLIVTITIVCLYRRKQKVKRSIRRYKEKLREQGKTDDTRNTYLVFLCYCSEDVHFATHTVYEELDRHLRDHFQLDGTLICIGDEHFTPGRAIATNIIHHIDRSKVILLLVSRAFCKSAWAEFETTVAHEDHKPIILMFIEDVPKKEMSPILRKLYSTQVRVFWKTKPDGQEILVPNWAKLGETILQYANCEFQIKQPFLIEDKWRKEYNEKEDSDSMVPINR